MFYLERELFIAFSFWHKSENDSPRVSPDSIFGLKGSFLRLCFILAHFWCHMIDFTVGEGGVGVIDEGRKKRG